MGRKKSCQEPWSCFILPQTCLTALQGMLGLGLATMSPVLQPQSNSFPWHTECSLKGS